MRTKKNTIYALSTPPGKSALAVIRISGADSYKIVKNLSTNMPNEANKACYNKIKTPSGELVDNSITTYFKSPRSYTGEDMVEISIHGGGAVIKKIIESIKKQGNLRIADPGEFTKRAFENNKLDLTQVEAVADIVNAETEIQRKQAAKQLNGFFSNKTNSIYNNLIRVLANTEAIIDFADEELPKNLLKKNKEQIKNIIKEINLLTKNNSHGMKVRNGYVVGVIGKTNTGKSSFINYISGQEVSIVTNKPGTTRDVLESYLDIKGLPLRFMDTAGIRKSRDSIEKIGILKSKRISEISDLNIVFIESVADVRFFKNINSAIFVQSKLDIRKKPTVSNKVYKISSQTGKGINKLLNKVHRTLYKKSHSDNAYISRERHLECLQNAKYFLETTKKEKSYDKYAESIRLGLKEISKIHGSVDIEDILDIIFKDFCIGK